MEKDYTLITCNKTGEVLKDKWTAFLPNSVFDEENYSEGEKFEMRTVTTKIHHETQERYKTTFSSDALYDNVLEGEWDLIEEIDESTNEDKIYKVKDESDDYDPIYLLLPEWGN